MTTTNDPRPASPPGRLSPDGQADAAQVTAEATRPAVLLESPAFLAAPPCP